MQFSNTTTLEGLIQECERITNLGTAGISGNTTRLKDFTARINMALDRYFALAFQADGRWPFDDNNQTAPPIESISLVSGQSRYELDDFASEILNINRAEVKDSAGQGILLTPLSLSDIKHIDYDEFYETASIPRHYLKMGEFIDLKPAPNYSLASALTIYFDRPKSAFVSTDTTKVPGIPSLHHGYLARYASLPYLIEKGITHKDDIANLVAIDEQSIIDHFSHRDSDVANKLGTNHRVRR